MGNETAINFSILSNVASANKKNQRYSIARDWLYEQLMQRQKINEFEAVGACVN